jgi:rubrerythrin
VPKSLSEEWWAEIAHEFQAHVREEEHFLRAYRELVAEIGDPSTRLLVELIIEDEERHHQLMARIAGEARGDAAGTGTSVAPRFSAEEAARLREPTERFLDAEREDRRRLRALADTLRPLRNENVWPLIVELMEIDTRKHVQILEYLHRRLETAKG